MLDTADNLGYLGEAGLSGMPFTECRPLPEATRKHAFSGGGRSGDSFHLNGLGSVGSKKATA